MQVKMKHFRNNLSAPVIFGSGVYLVTRLVHSLVAIVALMLYPLPPTAPQPTVHTWFEQWFLAPWYRWDAEWFLKIAREGYIIDDGRSGNYPLYPALVRVVGDPLGHNYLLSGLIVSNLALWLALILLYILIKRHYGDAIARKSLIALALYPSFFFNLGYYAESLLLLFTVATFYALETNRWGWAGIFSGLAVLAKLPGVILLAPIAWEFWQQRRRLFSRDVIALAAIPVTIAGWTVVRHYLGPEATTFDLSSPLSILSPILSPSYRQTYGAAVVFPWQGIWLGIQAVQSLWGQVMGLTVTFDMVMLVFFTLLLPFIARVKPTSYLIYTVGLYIMNLMLVVDIFPLVNFPRRMMMAFPAFIALAMLARYRWLKLVMVVTGGTLSLVMSAFFVWWLWIG